MQHGHLRAAIGRASEPVSDAAFGLQVRAEEGEAGGDQEGDGDDPSGAQAGETSTGTLLIEASCRDQRT